MPASVAFATCADLPNLEAGESLVVPLLAERGIEAEIVVWDDPEVDWYAYDLVVLRATHDYPDRRGFFVAWAKSVPHLANPAEIVEWNTDKHYLIDLAERGVPVVHTNWLEPSDGLTMMRLHTRFPAMGDFVIKPAISSGFHDAVRYCANTAYERGNAIRHALRLLQSGRSVMLQRYVGPKNSEQSEHSLVFLSGEYAYAMYKGPTGDHVSGGDAGALNRPDNMIAYTASYAERELANKAIRAALEAVPDPDRRLPLLYARVDLALGEDGEPVLMELQLTDPSLAPDLISGASHQMADAIARRLASSAQAQ